MFGVGAHSQTVQVLSGNTTADLMSVRFRNTLLLTILANVARQPAYFLKMAAFSRQLVEVLYLVGSLPGQFILCVTDNFVT